MLHPGMQDRWQLLNASTEVPGFEHGGTFSVTRVQRRQRLPGRAETCQRDHDARMSAANGGAHAPPFHMHANDALTGVS